MKLKFLYEFGLKEFDNNSVMLAFDIDADSLTKKITNDFKYLLPSFVVDLEDNISYQEVEQDNVIASKKNMIATEKVHNNEMMLSKKKLIKQDIVRDNEQNLMINSKKYYLFADQVSNKNNMMLTSTDIITKEQTDDDECNTIVNNLLLNMNKFRYSIDEYNDKNDTQIVLDDKPIIEYIKKNDDEYSPVYIPDEDEDDEIIDTNSEKLGSTNSNSSNNVKKYKIKFDDNDNNEIDLSSIKNLKRMNIEDKLLKLLDDDPYDNKTILQKKLNYKLRLTTAMNNISPTKNIIFIVTELMKYIDNFDLSGEDKKIMIIHSIKIFLTNEKIKEEDINFIINTVCPELIDILISVDKRKITIKKKISCFWGC